MSSPFYPLPKQMSEPEPCPYCAGGREHPQWAILLGDVRDLWIEDDCPSSWDFCFQPLWKLKCHNREKRYVAASKATKKGAPHHRLVVAIGPFFGDQAEAFVNVMKGSSRMFRYRLVRGYKLAQLWPMIDPHAAALHILSPSPDKVQQMVAGHVLTLSYSQQLANQAAAELLSA
jgi:hypothetical protein